MLRSDKTDGALGGWNSRLYCNRGARQSVWGPHPMLRATSPRGETGIWRPFVLFLLRTRSKLTVLPERQVPCVAKGLAKRSARRCADRNNDPPIKGGSACWALPPLIVISLPRSDRRAVQVFLLLRRQPVDGDPQERQLAVGHLQVHLGGNVDQLLLQLARVLHQVLR